VEEKPDLRRQGVRWPRKPGIPSVKLAVHSPANKRCDVLLQEKAEARVLLENFGSARTTINGLLAARLKIYILQYVSVTGSARALVKE